MGASWPECLLHWEPFHIFSRYLRVTNVSPSPVEGLYTRALISHIHHELVLAAVAPPPPKLKPQQPVSKGSLDVSVSGEMDSLPFQGTMSSTSKVDFVHLDKRIVTGQVWSLPPHHLLESPSWKFGAAWRSGFWQLFLPLEPLIWNPIASSHLAWSFLASTLQKFYNIEFMYKQ